jgi:ketosteroid isomerase-like protein/carbon monoxide dehydrogenase subunit G
MIEAEHTIEIDAGIDKVWDYVRDIRKWANFFPGCQDCELVDDNHSRWTIKVGAGGMVKTVNVLVHVEQWDGPERVNFSYKLKSEPVVGHGSYSAVGKGPRTTEIALKLQVQGSGQMAPMWEAMGRPLVPQLAKSFAGRLKAQIEGTAVPVESPGRVSRLAGWLRRLWRALFGTAKTDRSNEGRVKNMSEQNKQVVLKFIEAMGTSDPESAAKCLAPDVFTDAKGFCQLSGVRHYDTIVGTIGAFRKLLPTGLRPEVHNVIGEGDRVAVEFEGNATTFDGKAYNNQYCMVFTLADGKIKQVNEYFCTKLAEDVLWPSVQKMQGEFPSA